MTIAGIQEETPQIYKLAKQERMKFK